MTWESERAAHRARVQRWVNDRVERSLRGEEHPVYDFLFEYYTFRPAHLRRYSPGLGVILEGATRSELDWPNYFLDTDDGSIIEPVAFPLRRLPMLRFGVQFIETTLNRAPVFHCFGLHEWAMVYRAEEVRHGQVPLRLSHHEIARFVESHNLCCTHFDAFRFFTPDARSRNRISLDRYSAMEHDQPGCIHANMDLYKWAFHIAPFTSSKLIADTFELAWKAREIDMRASPYDLSPMGFIPIAIETKIGREEYVACQRSLYEMSQPIREEVLIAYQAIEQQVSNYVETLGDFSNGTSSWSSQASAASTGSR